ncbi:hypothetical protein [Burkholderia pseudomallei]|uniref:hypothetical protein n=1 Tax=Burkholderia pseudomallei TaxID=28450 RepID=UPI001AAEF145|nr:hypothetical protein [Burkholderia pseudomallei]MBO2977505.1 hypothetical protein [Burkholderia pseudomallei]MBO3047288.1 hypothetical protein [Burkholderia pseudomallei]
MRKIAAPRGSASLLDNHTYICDLLNVEGPVLSLLRDSQRNWLYLWCDTDGQRVQRWLAFPVSRAGLVAYLTKQVPLLPLVQQASQRLVIDAAFQDVFAEDGSHKGRTHHRSIKNVSDALDQIAEYLPTDDSYFDEELAPDISLAKEVNPTLFEVPIDGQWFLSDLDRFSRVYSQLYAFFYCTKPRFVKNLGGKVRRYLSAPWTGGYSRVNLFEALRGLIPSLHDLQIKKIQYASPGEIEIEALESVGDSISNAVKCYLQAEDSLTEAEKMINQLLGSKRLKRADLSSIRDDQLPLTKDNIDFLFEKKKEIGSALGIEEELALLNEYSPNIVVSMKVLIAMVTRIRRLAAFQSGGLLDLNRAEDELVN